jgi:hypothetical protein
VGTPAGRAHEVETLRRELAEFRRIEELDERPDEPKRNRPSQLFEHSPHYIAAVANARAGVLDDEEQRRIRAHAWAPEDQLDVEFDSSFVIRPVSVNNYADGIADELLSGVYATRAKPPPEVTDPRSSRPLTSAQPCSVPTSRW